MNQSLHITHHTTYSFDKAVLAGPHLIKLSPAPNCLAKIENYSLNIKPENHHLSRQQDVFANFVHRVIFYEKLKALDITVSFDATIEDVNPFDFFVDLSAANFPFEYESGLSQTLNIYLNPSLSPLELRQWVAESNLQIFGATTDFILTMNRLVHNKISYNTRMEQGVQTPIETINMGSGSCRDSTWLLIHIFRSFGVAARFVSGYLIDLNIDHPEKDELALHAWVEVYIPGAGWLGLDPTTGLLTTQNYIPLCAVPHFNESAPIIGNTEPCEVSLRFESKIERR